jgi:hypothetical protein
MTRKHAFLFFFNFDLMHVSSQVGFIFNDIFFDFFLKSQNSIFLFYLFDDLFSSFNIIFNSGFRVTTEPSAVLAVNYFFNKLIRFCF